MEKRKRRLYKKICLARKICEGRAERRIKEANGKRIMIEEIRTARGFVLEVRVGDRSCLFSNEEHAQIYEVLLEILEALKDKG